MHRYVRHTISTMHDKTTPPTPPHRRLVSLRSRFVRLFFRGCVPSWGLRITARRFRWHRVRRLRHRPQRARDGRVYRGVGPVCAAASVSGSDSLQRMYNIWNRFHTQTGSFVFQFVLCWCLSRLLLLLCSIPKTSCALRN